MRSLLTLLALMLLVPTAALASDTSLSPHKENFLGESMVDEPLVAVIPFGSDPDSQSVAEKLHKQGEKLHEHPGSKDAPQPILKEKGKKDPMFQFYYPEADRRAGLKIKIRLWSFAPDGDGVVKRFYVKPKISAEPRLMFTFKF